MSLPEHVTIVEVGPRDGLQNEDGIVPTAVKVAFIDRLGDVGAPVVEATSFVHPRWVPQLADGAEVLAGIRRRDDVRHPVLVPNAKGMEAAEAAGAQEISVFASASEGFSRANLNRSTDESLEMFTPVVARARDLGLRVRGYVSMVMGCPFQGEVPLADVAAVTEQLLAMGCDEISLGDTIGVGTPTDVDRLVDAVATVADLGQLAVHFHDTYGQGLANTLTALGRGITVADTSAGGLGGCPYAPGAKGNLATEDLVYALDGAGVHTGIDLDALIDVTAWMSEQLGRPPASRVAQARLATRNTEA